jgi:signal transduction histidine kinase/DNA-binding response OmpR family regulator
VLVVEDDAAARWMLAEALRARSYDVVEVADVEPAWDAFTGRRFPVVLLDLGLPGGDGIELCRRMRAHPHGSTAVIVVVTAHQDPAVLQATLEAGADDYVVKPLDLPVLNVRLAIAEQNARRRHASHQAEERFARQDHTTRVLLANLDEVVFSIHPSKPALLEVSGASQRVLGRSPEELIADEALWRALLYPREIQLREAELAHPGRTLVHRWPISMPDGATRWVQAIAKGAVDAHGRLERVDGVLADVTKNHRFEEELTARNNELRTLYRISEVTLAAPSPDRAYDELLEEVCKATGFPIGAIERYDAARGLMIITAARGIPLDGGPLEIPVDEIPSGTAALTGQPRIETNVLSRPKMRNPVLRGLGIQTWLAFPMVVGEQLVGTLSLAHTEVMQPDRRLVHWAGSLAAAVAQFLDRIAAEEDLRDSERRHRTLAEQLQQANEELERFAYSVSHDLRAPLRTMQGFAHALIQNFGERLPIEARDYAQRIIASGQQSEVLIRDLLAYSRLSFEQLEQQPLDLGQVVSSALDQLEGDIRESGARVRVEGALPTVLGQPTTLAQVIANLVSNAMKFVPIGRTPEIRIRAEEGPQAVRLWVEDNGIGVPTGQEERIFRVFERLTEGSARPGTGIGLAIVRRGMERLGGRAGVTPNPTGEGSAFWVDIQPVAGSKRRPWGRSKRRET